VVCKEEFSGVEASFENLLKEFSETGEIAPPKVVGVEIFEPEEAPIPHCCTDCGCECGECDFIDWDYSDWDE